MFASPPTDIINLKTNWFTKYVEKKFNMQINWVQVPNSDVTTKQSLLLSSGDYPDVFWNGSFSNADILKYAQQGILVPLNSLIKQYAPNLQKAIQTVPGLKQDVTAPDGNIYAIPSYNYCFHCFWSSGMWIDTSLLKKYGLQMPTTTQEFTHVLQVFKQHGLIPLTGATDGYYSNPITFLMNAFIYDDGTDYFDINNGKVVFAPIQAQWKQGLEYIHSLYTQGLLDHQALSQNMDTAKREIAQGKVAVVPDGGSNSFIDNIADPKSGFLNWLAVPALKGPSGVQYAAFSGNNPGNPTFAITNKATKDQEIKMMKLLNFIWTPTGTQIADFGPEGKYWTKAKKGQLGFTGKQALFNTNWSTFYAGNSQQNSGWDQMGPFYQSEAWRNGAVAIPPFTPDGSGNQTLLQLETEQNYAGHQPKYVYPGDVWIPTNALQQYSMEQTNIDNFVSQWMSEFIDGSKSIDKDWNQYVQGVENLGLAQYIKTSQSAMGQPFDTSSFTADPGAVKFLSSLKSNSTK
jgi:putative aldouronate transport system substrate-binding protein